MTGLNFRANWDFVFITGRKGKGKSVYGRYIIKKLRKRFLIWDRQHEYGDCGRVVNNLDLLEKEFLEWKHVVYQPVTYSDEEFERVCEFVLSQGNMAFVVEEVHEHAHARGYSTKLFQRIVRGGRHRGIGLIFLTRRPAVCHKDLRANADYVVTFQMHEEDDLKYISKWIGTTPKMIKELESFHSLLYNANEDSLDPQGKCDYP